MEKLKAIDEAKKATDLDILIESQKRLHVTVLENVGDRFKVKALVAGMDIEGSSSYVFIDSEAFNNLPAEKTKTAGTFFTLTKEETNSIKVYAQNMVDEFGAVDMQIQEIETKQTTLNELLEKKKQFAPKFTVVEFVNSTTDEFNVKALDDLNLDTLAEDVKGVVVCGSSTWNNIYTDDLAKIGVKQATRFSKFASVKGAFTVMAAAAIGATAGAIIAMNNDKKLSSLRSHQ